ncbi:MAG TPA: copper transporter [Mycobacteriales bacterium]|nr:copper transporter [Mycobacteriales bacterium]
MARLHVLAARAAMIDFRYHVVSIIAVFLALGTGIVLGSTALDRPIIDDLKRRTEGLAADKAELQDTVEELGRDVDASEEFAVAAARLVLPGRLTGQRVVVISAPDASKEVRDSLVTTVRQAGGRVTAQVRLLPRLVDPAAAAEIEDLLPEVATGITPPAGTVAHAAAELAAALDTEGAPDAEEAPTKTVRLISAFREAGLLAADGPSVLPGDLVLMVLATAEESADDEQEAVRDLRTKAMLAVVSSFAGRGAVVLAAPVDGAEDGSLLAAVRDDAALAARLSSVDFAGEPAGNIATVLALADAARREFGHYGRGPGAEAPLPALEPAPA